MLDDIGKWIKESTESSMLPFSDEHLSVLKSHKCLLCEKPIVVYNLKVIDSNGGEVSLFLNSIRSLSGKSFIPCYSLYYKFSGNAKKEYVEKNRDKVVECYHCHHTWPLLMGTVARSVMDGAVSTAPDLAIKTHVRTDKGLKYVEYKESPPIRVALGATETKGDVHTVTHSIGTQAGVKLDAEVKGKWIFVEASIKAALELQASSKIEESSTTSREVTIPGNGKAYKLVWFETYRTGNATTLIDGKEHEVLFQFREGWDLQTRVVED